MGCNGCHTCRHGLVGFAILILIFFVSCSSFLAEGRAAVQFSGPSKRAAVGEMAIARIERIGSMPPRCDRKCSWCGRCEAIQVPMDPRESKPLGHGKSSGSSIAAGEYYSRNRGGDDGSNYKPMSWKCKCGRFIFDP